MKIENEESEELLGETSEIDLVWNEETIKTREKRIEGIEWNNES